MDEKNLVWFITWISSVNFGILSIIWAEIKGMKKEQKIDKEKTDLELSKLCIALSKESAKLEAIDQRFDLLPCPQCKNTRFL